jgi:hypothetical protein
MGRLPRHRNNDVLTPCGRLLIAIRDAHAVEIETKPTGWILKFDNGKEVGFSVKEVMVPMVGMEVKAVLTDDGKPVDALDIKMR